MAAEKKLPGWEWLEDALDRKDPATGLPPTWRQIADRWYEESGVRAVPEAFSMAARRYEIKVEPRVPRYHDEIPWQVPAVYKSDRWIKLLRWVGQVRAGTPMTADSEKRMRSSLRKLAEEGEVSIAYSPSKGPVIVPRDPDNDVNLAGDDPKGHRLQELGFEVWIVPPRSAPRSRRPARKSAA